MSRTDLRGAREDHGEVPRAVYCASWHLHQDLEQAEAACRGRFEHGGVALDLGLPPDWNSALPDDEEWGIAWYKFYIGLDLASAFRVTGDIRYLEAWESLVDSWIDQAPARFGSSDVIARRVQNWIFAWEGFARAPSFPGLREGLIDRMLSSLASQAQAIRGNLTRERNHRTLELFSLSIVALAIPKLDLDGTLLEFVVEELHQNLMRDLLPDGVQRELSTHYHMTVLRNLLAYRENARRFEIFVEPEFDERLQRACDFALHMHRPDGTIPMLSDSDGGSYLELLAIAADLYDREDYRFVASRGRLGLPPAAQRISFPSGGYFVDRSDWAATTKAPESGYQMIFDCGPLGAGGHGHYDALHLELFAGGTPLLVDPGRYTYHEGNPNWRHWFKGTRAHNTVCVDGLDQTPYRRGKPKTEVAQTRLRHRFSTPALDVVYGEVRSAAYRAIHSRRVIGVAGSYWLVIDTLRSHDRHQYDLRFHLAEGALEFEPSPSGTTTVARSRSARIETWPRTRTEVQQGWISPRYGIKLEAPVLSSTRESESNVDFVTLVSSTGADACWLDEVSLNEDGSGSVRVRISDREMSDWVAWGEAPVSHRRFGFDLIATAVWLRNDADGRTLSCEAAGCERAEGPDGATYFSGRRPSSVGFDLTSRRFMEVAS